MQPFNYTIDSDSPVQSYQEGLKLKENLLFSQQSRENDRINAETNARNAQVNNARMNFERQSATDKMLDTAAMREIEATLKAGRKDLARDAVSRYVNTKYKNNPELKGQYSGF